MFTKNVVSVHKFNGFVEPEIKFVEVEGKKFVDDGSGKAKLDDKGQPIPFTENNQKPEIKDLSNAQLEELAKVNPHVAKLLSDKTEADAKEAARIKKEEDDKRKAAEEKGEWQSLAQSEKTKREELEGKLAEKEELLGKYKGSVDQVLKEILSTIPKENLGLIPEEFSPRQKLEYIIKNAKTLGAKITNIKGDDGIQKNSNELQKRVSSRKT